MYIVLVNEFKYYIRSMSKTEAYSISICPIIRLPSSLKFVEFDLILLELLTIEIVFLEQTWGSEDGSSNVSCFIKEEVMNTVLRILL